MSRTALRYGLAVAIVSAAALVDWALSGFVTGALYLTFFPAVVVAAILGGTGPGLVATIISALYVDLFITPPIGQLSLNNPADVVRGTIFLLGGVGVSLLAGMTRAAQARDRRKTEELTQLAEHLRISEENLRFVAERGEVGHWNWNIQTDQLEWSPLCKRLFGIPLDETMTRSRFLAALHPDDRGRADLAVHTCLDSGGQRDYSIECRVQRPDGNVRWILTKGSAMFDSGRAVRMAGVAVDITEHKRAEEALRELNETLERRVAERTAELEHRLAQLRAMTTELTLAEHRERERIAKILHDHLQQLLVGAKFNVATVQGQSSDPAVRKSLGEASDLLDDSLNATRSLTTELFPPALHAGTFAEALRWLVQWMREKHDLQVHMKVDEHVNPEAEEIRLVLFEATRELLFNVVKHAGVREACLEMLANDGDYVRITIADAGQGFDVSSLHPGSRTEGGFGMVNIRERLRLLGGRIEVASTPGEGTRATLVAPLRGQSRGAGEQESR